MTAERREPVGVVVGQADRGLTQRATLPPAIAEQWADQRQPASSLYRARRTLHTGADLLTDKQAARLTALFAIDEHVEVEATWGIYQRIIAAYRHPTQPRAAS